MNYTVSIEGNSYKSISSLRSNSIFLNDFQGTKILAPKALNRSKENGVTLFTILSYSSNKLQPLCISVFGTLQTYCTFQSIDGFYVNRKIRGEYIILQH